MGFDYGFEYVMPDVMSGAAAGLITGILLVVYFMAMVFSVASYVLGALGMYRIAKRRGIYHKWLAWIPIGNRWLLGCISDHYQYVVKQKITNRRKVLLTLSLIALGAGLVFGGGLAATIMISGGMEVYAAVAMALCAVAYFVVMGLGIAIAVISYISYYDLYRSCKPNTAVLFLILSVIFHALVSFFVFFASNSEEGMPPRFIRQPEQPPREEPKAEPKPEPEETEIPVVEAEIVEDFE